MIGETNRQLTNRLRRRGIAAQRIVDLGGQPALGIWDRIAALAQDRAIVVGIGNIGGAGAELIAAVPSRAAATPEDVR